MTLTTRFLEAIRFAEEVHSQQVRKTKGTPYLAHVLGVASLVLENGATEDEAIAALLHDALEDGEADVARPEISQRFGQAVLAIVEGCTDSEGSPKPPWRQRKQAYLKHLAGSSRSVLLVAVCDKLYNALSILMDYQTSGEAVWRCFSGGREGTLWYYRQLLEVFGATGGAPAGPLAELARAVAGMEALGSPLSTAGATHPFGGCGSLP